MSQNIQELKKEFLQYLEIEKGRSLKTIENYERYLDRFFKSQKIENSVEIDKNSTRQFRLFIARQGGEKGNSLKKNTQNYHMIALRSFLKYLSKNDIKSLAPEKIELAKTPQRELELVNKTEFRRLLSFPLKKIEDFRDLAILELLYSTGLRVSELCSLKSDLDLDQDEFSIRGKGEKVRIVFLSDDAKKTIKNYQEKLKEEGKFLFPEFLFLTSTGKNIDPRTIQRILKKRGAQAGIFKKLTPHTIRHFYATELLQNGADIRSVQMMLGHASINTTQIYTNLSDRFLKEVHKKFHKK